MIFNLVPLVLLLLVGGIVAIYVLQDVLERLSHIKHHADAAKLLEMELSRFRAIVLGLGIIFVLLINISVVVLIRTATNVLKPMNALVEATRQLANGAFNHRVTIRKDNELDELAEAYNNLAEHLQASEKQRMEVLGQVGLALNHELNNAMATIELQLGMLGRGAAGDQQAARRLSTIHDSLARMKDTLQSLRSARRIVLTDYSPGMKMLDLVQSSQEESALPQPSAS